MCIAFVGNRALRFAARSLMAKVRSRRQASVHPGLRALAPVVAHAAILEDVRKRLISVGEAREASRGFGQQQRLLASGDTPVVSGIMRVASRLLSRSQSRLTVEASGPPGGRSPRAMMRPPVRLSVDLGGSRMSVASDADRDADRGAVAGGGDGRAATVTAVVGNDAVVSAVFADALAEVEAPNESPSCGVVDGTSDGGAPVPPTASVAGQCRPGDDDECSETGTAFVSPRIIVTVESPPAAVRDGSECVIAGGDVQCGGDAALHVAVVGADVGATHAGDSSGPAAACDAVPVTPPVDNSVSASASVRASDADAAPDGVDAESSSPPALAADASASVAKPLLSPGKALRRQRQAVPLFPPTPPRAPTPAEAAAAPMPTAASSVRWPCFLLWMLAVVVCAV
jgi:hypothetical protein